eukprot:1195177-Prorocentrum_minimum.AAC.2
MNKNNKQAGGGHLRVQIGSKSGPIGGERRVNKNNEELTKIPKLTKTYKNASEKDIGGDTFGTDFKLSGRSLANMLLHFV